MPGIFSRVPTPLTRVPARVLVGAAAVAAVTGAAVAAPAATPSEPESKTRVYVVVIDGLNPEEVELMPFLSSLADGGTYYPESRSVMIAETTPNHVSMVTGVYPDRSGIVANNFPDVESGEPASNGEAELLEADSIFTLVARQCPELTTAAVTSKDYLFRVMNHDRTGDGQVDADVNFANVDDPTFLPIAGLTPDERTIVEAARVSSELDPDFLFVNLGSVDRVGHVDEVGGLTEPIGSRPAIRDVQRTLTDGYLRTFVELLQADGRWDDTALLVTADHSMDWSLPTSTVSLFPQFQADPMLVDQVVVAQNGGAALYSLLDRDAPEAPERLARMREIALATEGVDEALYRQPNPVDGGEEHWVETVHPDWHQTHPRSGDLILTVEDGRRVTEPEPFSNPIPGNHGMTSTVRIPFVVSGGLDVVRNTVTGASDDPTERDEDQAENVDVAPTAAWLLGVAPPQDGFDGRVLTEAFASRPAASCGAEGDGRDSSTPPPPATGAPSSPDAADRARTGPTATAGSDNRDTATAGRATLPATGLLAALPGAALLALAAAAALRRRTDPTR